MKFRNVMTVLGTAALTVAVTLALAALRGEGIARAGPAVKPVIAQPQLESQGCKFTLKTDKTTYEAGESPVIEVTASNPSDKPLKATVWVNVWATSPLSPMSRMLPRPHSLWSQELVFSLEPKESKSLSATCEAKLPALQDVRITLGDKKGAVMAPNVAVPAGAVLNNQRSPAGQAGGPNMR